MTDAELLERARRGEVAAFGALVDRHRDAVVRAAVAALGDHAEAEDVAQDALVSAWRHLGTFRGEASVRTWLLAITWRTAISRRRSLRRWWHALGRTDAHDRGDALDQVRSADASPEAAALDAEFAAAVRRVVSSLGARLRDPLLLAASGEYSMQEIADMLGAPVGTVKWRVSEARRLLRAKLTAVGMRPDARV